jgi:putative oxidoreductase
MKIVVLIARILLGVIFLLFGSNIFLHFLPTPPMPPGQMATFSNVLQSTGYVYVVGFFQVVSAILLLINRYVPLALTMLGPVLVNILIFHVTMAPSGIAPGLFATILWFIVFWSVRSAFAGLFQQRVAD